MGHSKGGAEALLMILRHPELVIENIVDRVVILQGAIGGSPLAEPQNQNYLLQLAGKWIQPGFNSLQPSRMKSVFQEALETAFQSGLIAGSTKGAIDPTLLFQQIHERIFYVLADKTDGTIGPGIGLVLTLVGHRLDHLGPNDGLVLLKDQVLKSRHQPVALGRILARLPVDHLGTTVKYFSATTSRYQKTFMISCMAQIFDPTQSIDEDQTAIELIQQQFTKD